MTLEVTEAAPHGPPRPHPLLFVHGAWHGAWCWGERFMPYFAERGYRCRAVSLRGHGTSPARSLRWSSIHDYVADVAEVVAAMESPPIVVGHSMGGLVTQRFLEHRSLPGAALLASVPKGGVLRAVLRVARRHPLRFLRANLTMRLWPVVATPDLARELLFSEGMAADEVRRHWGRLQDESYRAFIGMLVRRPRPERVATPVWVLGGTDDALFSVAETTALADAYGTDAVIVPDLAHDVMLDTKWEAAAEALAVWLETIP